MASSRRGASSPICSTRPVRQPGAQSSQTTQIPDGLQIGLGTTPVSTGRIFTQGSLQQTGNSLDMAIDGAGFFQVLLPDGTNAYTRDGSFQKDNQGQIVTANGYPCSPRSPSRRTP
jgi:flagellar basal-body rod protein FlgG